MRACYHVSSLCRYKALVEITKKTRLQVIVAATVSEIAATTVGVAAPALVVFRTDKEGVKTVWSNP